MLTGHHRCSAGQGRSHDRARLLLALCAWCGPGPGWRGWAWPAAFLVGGSALPISDPAPRHPSLGTPRLLWWPYARGSRTLSASHSPLWHGWTPGLPGVAGPWACSAAVFFSGGRPPQELLGWAGAVGAAAHRWVLSARGWGWEGQQLVPPCDPGCDPGRRTARLLRRRWHTAALAQCAIPP